MNVLVEGRNKSELRVSDCVVANASRVELSLLWLVTAMIAGSLLWLNSVPLDGATNSTAHAYVTGNLAIRKLQYVYWQAN